jgi:hypothetical protein
MKPLQTLDHVMLWIARVVAALVLSYGLYELLYAFTASDIRVRRNFLVETACLQTALGVFCLACLFSIQRFFARLLLGLTAGYFLLRSVIFLFSFLLRFHFYVSDWSSVLFVAAIATSMAVHVLFILVAILQPGERRNLSPHSSGPSSALNLPISVIQ